MKIDSAKIEALRELLAAPHRKIVLVAHTNPDGDAIGASTAWRDVLAAMGHEVTMIVPNKYPYFLDWMPDIREVVIFRFAPERALEAIRGADIVFCLDFNSLSRLEALSDALAENTAARRVLIDHHLSPDGGFDLQFSYPQSSSTCFLLYCIIEQLCGTEVITRKMAEALYVGMMTDTGNFSFSFLTPALYRALAVLVEKGIDVALDRLAFLSGYADKVRAGNMHELMMTHEALHLLESCRLSTLCTRERKESGRSIYRRSDYPEKDPAYEKILAVRKGTAGPEVFWLQ